MVLPQKIEDCRISSPVVIETKVAPSIKNDARLQLKNYLLSLPLNNAAAVNKARDGIILNWQSNLDAMESVSQDNLDIELWTMGNNKEIKNIYTSNLI